MILLADMMPEVEGEESTLAKAILLFLPVALVECLAASSAKTGWTILQGGQLSEVYRIATQG